MRKPQLKPLFISPVPEVTTAPVSRAMTIKKIMRLRMNWFVVGSVCGIGASFFMHFVVTTLVVPGYHLLSGPSALLPAQEASNKTSADQDDQTADAGDDADNTNKSHTATAAAKPAVTASVTYPRTLALEIGHGKTLLDLLLANRVQVSEAHSVINALKGHMNPSKLKAGQKISLTLARHEKLGDAAAVRELAIRLPNLDTIELSRLDNGSFNVAALKEQLTEHGYRGFGKVKTSLSQAASDGNIPMSAMNEVIKAYSYDIDFQREIHPGDSIEVLMDRKTTADGRVGGYGPPRYAVLTLKGKKHEIFRFKNAYGDYAWFDGNGNSVKKSLLRTPINAAHITSGFGMRMHPLLGYSKMHKGVDFGASTGTPIMAAGDGVVEFKGWKTGYGNFVLIRHNKTYETAYAHCSRFGSISVGNRVRQGQIIAYVGMTGGATGPHLHYEVRQNEVQVNPVAKQFNMASGLTGKQLAAFKANKQAAVKELASLGGAAPAKTAEAAPAKPAKPAKLASR